MNTEVADIKRAIEDSLSPTAMEFWCGFQNEGQNEFVIFAQRNGVAAAVAELEAQANDSIIRELASEYEDARFESDGYAAYGRED